MMGDDPVASPQVDPSQSPLKEVDWNSIEELLSRDPFEFQGISRIEATKALRAQRASWELMEKEGKSLPKEGKTAKAKKAALPVAMNLEDLGLADVEIK